MNGDRSPWKWFRRAWGAFGAGLAALPLLAVLVRGLLVWNDATPHPSLSGFGGLAGDPRFWSALGNSLIAATGTTVLSLGIGFTLAFLVVRTNMPGKRWLGPANMLPFFLSPYAGAVAWTWLLAPHDGVLENYARTKFHISLAWLEIYSVPGVIFVLTLFQIPVVYLFMVSALRNIDASFEDTARIHGATFWHRLRHITVPMVQPALSAAAVVVFVTSAGLFDVPAALGAPRGISFIPTEIYAMARETSGTGRAAAFSVVMVIAALALTLWHRWIASPAPAFVRPGKSYRARVIRLGWSSRIAALTLQTGYLTAAVLLPLAALLLVAFSREWTGRFEWRMATTAHFASILSNHELARVAIFNSLVVALTGATLILVLALSLGYYPNRGNRWNRAWTETLPASSHGIPAIVVGLGVLLLAAGTRFYGTLGIVVIACIARFIPIATRLAGARMREIDPDLERGARSAGASAGQATRYIIVPLLRRSLAASWLLLFAFLVRELGTPILLYAQGNETMSVAMLQLRDRDAGQFAVLAVMQMTLLAVAFLMFTISRAAWSPRPS